MAPAIPWLMFAGAAVSAYGAYKQGEAAKAAADYNAEMSRREAELARADARMQALREERETMLRIGAARAAQGASGGTAEGSFIDIIGNLAQEGELQRQWILYAGERKAAGFKNTASLDEMRGRSAQQQGYIQAASSLGSGLTSAYGARDRYRGPSRGE